MKNLSMFKIKQTVKVVDNPKIDLIIIGFVKAKGGWNAVVNVVGDRSFKYRSCSIDKLSLTRSAVRANLSIVHGGLSGG